MELLKHRDISRAFLHKIFGYFIENMEQLPNEVLVIIFEYSTTYPQDFASWSHVSRLFRGIAKANCFETMSKSLITLSRRNKEIERQQVEKDAKQLAEKQKLWSENHKKSLELAKFRDLCSMQEKQILKLRRQPDSSGYVRMDFNY
ncbi:hypothetical protein D1R32_gp464 [Tunisvirus fontaine2]|uniref:F-box domain-containing protein n=1 Tax=Tunisvirus fontaine2 TaxID=1421067 RepID=V9SFR9_9VIRU|nr:hypothetical protein D1R32_gp464 [Tunisvirus fontaine2]AHC55181.1 hypothetical protein TNS_ORF463 [Tunisvirus fontaine2]